MPNIPDFSLKQSFPIASVIEAAQRRAQIEQQDREFQGQQLLQGLQAFGGIADSLVKRRQQMAQATKMGTALGMTPEETQGMTPEQVIHVGTVKNKSLDLLQLLPFQNKDIVKEPWYQAAIAAHSPATPQQASAPMAPAVPTQMSSVSPSLTPAPSVSGAPLTPSTTAPFDVSQSTNTRPADLLQNLFNRPMNPATSAAALKILHDNRQVPVMTPEAGLATGSVPVGTKFEKPSDSQGGKADKEYDTLENQVINRIVGIRGDKSLARTEEQRDAAIQAYNTIAQIKNEHREPNQLEYYDILGQMWKARTGTSPTDQSIRDLDTKTFKGDLGKAYQYFSGTPAPRTTEGVMEAIQSFADVSGKQADKLHSGYMQSHLVKPRNMSQGDFNNIVKAHRGMTFDEATADNRVSATSSGVPQVGQIFNGAKVLSVKRVK